MKSAKVPVSDSYHQYLIDYLHKNPQLAAAYLTTTLAEENPETELLQQAVTQVYQALLKLENQDFHNLLDLEEAKSIYKFIGLLKSLSLELSISSFEKPEQSPLITEGKNHEK